nr:uncharacterized protein aq_250-like [Nerophis lumbriciformis]
MRESLGQKRSELLSFYEHDIRVGKESNDVSSDDFADRANNSYNRELMFSLSDTERGMLLQVEAALERLDSGEFGACTHCNRSIGKPRLNAVPWARYCIDCQELEEKGLLND